ncbi:MAG: hypothetical protein ABH869_00645, partial [Candidatus Omnitrophota bacterium]
EDKRFAYTMTSIFTGSIDVPITFDMLTQGNAYSKLIKAGLTEDTAYFFVLLARTTQEKGLDLSHDTLIDTFEEIKTLYMNEIAKLQEQKSKPSKLSGFKVLFKPWQKGVVSSILAMLILFPTIARAAVCKTGIGTIMHIAEFSGTGMILRGLSAIVLFVVMMGLFLDGGVNNQTNEWLENGKIISSYVNEYDDEGNRKAITYDSNGAEIKTDFFLPQGMLKRRVNADRSSCIFDNEGSCQFRHNFDSQGNFVNTEEYEKGNLVRVVDSNGEEIQRKFYDDDFYEDSYYVYTCFPGTEKEKERGYYDGEGNYLGKESYDKEGKTTYSYRQEKKVEDGIEYVTSVEKTEETRIIQVREENKEDNGYILLEQQQWHRGKPLAFYNYRDDADVCRQQFIYPNDGSVAAIEEQYDEEDNLMGTKEYDHIEDLLDQFSEPDGEAPVDTGAEPDVSFQIKVSPKRNARLAGTAAFITALLLTPVLASAEVVTAGIFEKVVFSGLEAIWGPAWFAVGILGLGTVFYVFISGILNHCADQTGRNLIFGSKGGIKKINLLFVPLVVIGVIFSAVLFEYGKGKVSDKKVLSKQSELLPPSSSLPQSLSFPRKRESITENKRGVFSDEQKDSEAQISAEIDPNAWNYPEPPEEIRNNPYFVERKLGNGPWQYIDVYMYPYGRYDEIQYLYVWRYNPKGNLKRVYGIDKSGYRHLLIYQFANDSYSEYEYLENGNTRVWKRDSDGDLNVIIEKDEKGRQLKSETWDNGVKEKVSYSQYDDENNETKYVYDGTERNLLGIKFYADGALFKKVAQDGSYEEIDRNEDRDVEFIRNYDPEKQFVSIEEYDERGVLINVIGPDGEDIQKVFCSDDYHGYGYYVYDTFAGTDQEAERFYYNEEGACYQNIIFNKDGHPVYCEELKAEEGIKVLTVWDKDDSSKTINVSKKDGPGYCLQEYQKWIGGTPIEITDERDDADVYQRKFEYDGIYAVTEKHYNKKGDLVNTINYEKIEDFFDQFSEPEGDVPVDPDKDFSPSISEKILPKIESFELADKSIYDMQINNIHKQIFSKIQMSLAAAGFIEKTKSKDLPEKYISVSAKSFADLRFIGNFIRDKGLSKEQASKFIQVRLQNKNISYDNLEMCMKEADLDLHISNVKIVSSYEEIDLKKTLEIVKETFGKGIDVSKIVIGDTDALVRTEEDRSILLGQKSPVYVEMQGEGIVSQLLQTLLEIAANDSVNIPESLGVCCNEKTGYKNWYIYLPNIEAVDFEQIRTDIENYEKILIML